MPYTPTPPRRIEALSTLFQQGKIQMPAEIRRLLNVKDGEKIVWVLQDNKVVVEKA